MGTVDLCRRSDAELVAACREGSKDAFAVLVGRHRSMALVLVRRLLRDEDLAADTLQEATVAALVGLERLHSPARFGAWYAGIALNMARRWLRRPSVEPVPAELVDGGPGPEEQVEAAEVAARVRGDVAALEARPSDALNLAVVSMLLSMSPPVRWTIPRPPATPLGSSSQRVRQSSPQRYATAAPSSSRS